MEKWSKKGQNYSSVSLEQPLPLMELCRFKIGRQMIGKNNINSDCFPIPTQLHSYLTYSTSSVSKNDYSSSLLIQYKKRVGPSNKCLCALTVFTAKQDLSKRIFQLAKQN